MLSDREVIDLLLGTTAIRVVPSVYYVRRPDGGLDWYNVYGVPVPHYIMKRTDPGNASDEVMVWRRGAE